MDKIAVLIPCYNEESTIGKVVSEFKGIDEKISVYVYDNNSTDKTWVNAEKAGAIVRREYHQGKGNVVRRMFREIDAECYVIVDGDDTYSATDAKEMIHEILDNKVDMVIGDRLSTTYYNENKRPFHSLGNKIVKTTINKLFNSEIQDVMTGYRAFSYQFVKTFPITSEGFEIETEMTIHALDKNMLIKNIQIEYKDRQEGSCSKLNTMSDGIKVFRTIGNLYKNYKPLHLFFSIFLILFIIAICLFIPILFEFIETGIVPRFPTLIVSGVVGMSAIMSLFTGFILSVVANQNRQMFEYKLTMVSFQYNLIKEEKRK